MATIRDVARAAGVSISSVSRVLNGTAPISAPVREVVLNAARELNYQPNALARSLITGRTHAVGLLVSDITNPFYGELLHALERKLSRNGYEILLCTSSYDLDRERAFVHSLLLRRVDAVVISLGHGAPDLVAELGAHGIPVVVHWAPPLVTEEQRHEEPPHTYTIGHDFLPGLDALAEHLVGLGHQQVCVFTGPGNLLTAADRRDAFLAALARRGAAGVPVPCDFTMAGAHRAMRCMLQHRSHGVPTAVVAGNDFMAFGILQALREAGLSVPGDVSVAGLDDVAFARVMNPPLTSVRSSTYRTGLETARLVLTLLAPAADRPAPERRITLKTKLIVRESTAQARRQLIP